MIEVRKHPNVTEALYISDVGLKLPGDHSWVVISDRFSVDEIEGSKDLQGAYKMGLIEVRVDEEYEETPSWVLEMYSNAVRVPVELLEDNEIAAVQRLGNLKASAHPIMWAIIRLGLFDKESEGQNRSAVLDALQ